MGMGMDIFCIDIYICIYLNPSAAYASFFFFGPAFGHQMGAILSDLDHTLRKCY